jgi:hypothetical protein
VHDAREEFLRIDARAQRAHEAEVATAQRTRRLNFSGVCSDTTPIPLLN